MNNENEDPQKPETPANPLLRYTLSGLGNQLEERSLAQTPLLGELCLTGEISIWYAPPNSGKTLIALHLALEAVAAKRIRPDKVFYVNVDDSTAGVAAKVSVLDDYGIHSLAEGEQGFRASALIPAMEEMIRDGSAHGTLIILDTLKKFTDLMSKKDSATFGKTARRFAMANGSLLALAHTNKHRGAGGKLVFAGTTDVMEDSDNVYVIDVPSETANTKERVVEFQNSKSRGTTAAKAFYAYSIEPGLSYLERLSSVRWIEDPEDDEPHRPSGRDSEADVIQSIKLAIQHGSNKKMQIVRMAAGACRTSRRKVLRILEKHTGEDPKCHLWTFERKDRGANVFRVLTAGPPSPELQ
jgi:hypothetical protein